MNQGLISEADAECQPIRAKDGERTLVVKDGGVLLAWKLKR